MGRLILIAELSLMWYDDSGKKSVSLKIEEAVAAYVRHFKSHPNVVLVNEKEVEPVTGVIVRPATYVRLNNFWVGWEDQTA